MAGGNLNNALQWLLYKTMSRHPNEDLSNLLNQYRRQALLEELQTPWKSTGEMPGKVSPVEWSERLRKQFEGTPIADQAWNISMSDNPLLAMQEAMQNPQFQGYADPRMWGQSSMDVNIHPMQVERWLQNPTQYGGPGNPRFAEDNPMFGQRAGGAGFSMPGWGGVGNPALEMMSPTQVALAAQQRRTNEAMQEAQGYRQSRQGSAEDLQRQIQANFENLKNVVGRERQEYDAWAAKQLPQAGIMRDGQEYFNPQYQRASSYAPESYSAMPLGKPNIPSLSPEDMRQYGPVNFGPEWTGYGADTRNTGPYLGGQSVLPQYAPSPGGGPPNTDYASIMMQKYDPQIMDAYRQAEMLDALDKKFQAEQQNMPQDYGAWGNTGGGSW